MKTTEIEQIIWSIQKEIYIQTNLDYFDIKIISNGFRQTITFLNIEIWSSWNDMRKYVDDHEDVFESLEVFLKREIMSVLYQLRRIDL